MCSCYWVALKNIGFGKYQKGKYKADSCKYLYWMGVQIYMGQDDILGKKKGVNVLQIQYNEKQKIPHWRNNSKNQHWRNNSKNKISKS